PTRAAVPTVVVATNDEVAPRRSSDLGLLSGWTGGGSPFTRDAVHEVVAPAATRWGAVGELVYEDLRPRRRWRLDRPLRTQIPDGRGATGCHWALRPRAGCVQRAREGVRCQ